MRRLSKSTLKVFWRNYPDSKTALETWHEEVRKANRQRELSLAMIRQVHKALQIPLESLINEYALRV